MAVMRKFITAVTLISLLLTAAGCASNGGNKSSETPKPSAEQTALNPDAPGWKDNTDPITFDWYLNYSWFQKKWGSDPTSQYITKKTGVNLNLIVPAGNENEKINTMIASGKLPDLITLDANDDAVKRLIEGKMVLPLNELADQYDPYFYKVIDPSKASWFAEPDGNFYGYPNNSSSPRDYAANESLFTSTQTFMVRKDMYEALGKPDMRTPEGFINALKLAKEKFPEVDGQPLIPLGLHEFTDTGNYALENYLQNFLAIPQEVDGKLNDRTTNPEYISWLKTFRQANSEGLLSKDIFIDKRPQMEEKIAQGRYFAMLFQWKDMSSQQNIVYQKDPSRIYMSIDGPSNSKLEPPTLSGPEIGGWGLTLISKDVKDKKRAIEFLTYMISEEGQKDFALGEKGVTYDTIDGKDQLYQKVIDETEFDYGTQYSYFMMTDYSMWLRWAPPTKEQYTILEDWTRGKTHNFSAFSNLNPQGTTEEGIISQKIRQQWGKALPKMILSKSDEDFDVIFNDFLQDREKLGFDKVVAFQQKKYEENVAKLTQ
ncbi:extracellular solute-binding protein [Paenibacillus pinisoli]|uniref:Extracellular solute-binding protein n=1 Tax=Paenibacillus pinisoli TaxID=1276110 RepID=A0A3A6Q6U1_9BACL|nr:extracellular solute-binding protein [Paenibacillus pinisoli]